MICTEPPSALSLSATRPAIFRTPSTSLLPDSISTSSRSVSSIGCCSALAASSTAAAGWACAAAAASTPMLSKAPAAARRSRRTCGRTVCEMTFGMMSLPRVWWSPDDIGRHGSGGGLTQVNTRRPALCHGSGADFPLGRKAVDTQTITLRLPASLVERIEETARRRGRSRSALFEEALRQYLAGDQLSRSEADMTVARDAGTDEPLYKLNEG
ncbi:hypothetical protein CAL13_11630 [Bordetella genomosp. 9]|uniref:Ribbon-helix-helix protein CopG domain-containing protein n=1 Tax=Bordetella genomosp. 9 TaxID=1416803 RepID=A0A1W6Z0B2_9BORD|nr:hypothetical protein CAL13_11630 [Bordetella genomosp. 9]